MSKGSRSKCYYPLYFPLSWTRPGKTGQTLLTAFALTAAALCLPPKMSAQTTVTITGTVYPTGGVDAYGDVFVSTHTSTPLSGPFTLVFHFDKAEGATTNNSCGGHPSSSYTVGPSSGNGATATLTIMGKSFTFGGGGWGQNAGAWFSARWGAFSCDGYPNGASSEGVAADYSDGTGRSLGSSYIGWPSCCGDTIVPDPSSGANFGDAADWQSTVFYLPANTSPAYAIPFNIEYFPTSGSYYAYGYLTPQSIQINGQQPTELAKTQGGGNCNCYRNGANGQSDQNGQTIQPELMNGMALRAEPINLATGNIPETFTDYTTSGQNPLAFIRYYNSAAPFTGTLASMLGVAWRSNYDRYLHLQPESSPTTVIAERPNGQGLTFTLSGGTWTPDTDVDYTLTNSGSTWTLTGPDDTVETYADNTHGAAMLNSIALRNGYTQTLTYSGGLLSSVGDSYNRSLSFVYYGGTGLVETVTTPDSSTGISYSYNASLSGGAKDQLASVTYPTVPATTLTYLYENPSFPFALTGIKDESGNRYVTWGYDSQGRGTSSKFGDTLGANLTTITYNSDGTVTATNAGGVADTYMFSILQGIPKTTGISRAATSTTAAATESLGYDNDGYLNDFIDWNGNEIQYTNNSHGMPTKIKKAYGTSVEQDTAISYDTTLVHLPVSIATTGLTTSFTYEAGTGNVLTRTETDTTNNNIPYSTNGTTRTWTNTWGTGGNVGLLLTLTGPRTDMTQETQFGYTDGVLTSITDPLNHVTTVNTYTGGGLPTKITDLNGVMTTFTYDGRQRLLTRTVNTSGGNLTTTYTYDNAGNLTEVELPDSSYLSYTYDNAHRLTKITNTLSEYISYGLDALGDRTESDIYDSSGTMKLKHTAAFDALGRMLTDVAYKDTSTPLATTYAYDKNGNVTSITDPKGHATGQVFDALNRLYRITDRLSHDTTMAYDAHDKVTSVTDPNGNATSYTRDGFEDVTQQVSPDSGTSIYRYDLASNLTKKMDGASIETDHSYDKLNRELTASYPADPTQNVSKTYDQATGHGDGIGHLTEMSDPAGTIDFTYDERGNDTYESRVYGTNTSTETIAYDNASRIASIINPSGYKAEWMRDAAGQVKEVAFTPPGGSTTPLVGSSTSPITHLPFGPVLGMAFANGVTRSNTYDLAYRMRNLIDSGTATVQNLTYTYDNNGNLTSITDGVNSANSQKFGYDSLDRLTSANRDTGGYGSLSYTYDNNGNRLTDGSSIYSYTNRTNILGSISAGSYTFGYNGAGSNTTITAGGTLQFTNSYSPSQRLASVTASGTPQTTIGTYIFDGFHDRAMKSTTVATIFKYGHGSNPFEESNTVGQGTDYIYLDPSSPTDDNYPVAMLELLTSGGTTTETTYYVHADRIGTPQNVTDGSQTSQWSTTYYPFGETGTITTSGITQNLRFPGQYFDSETGLYNNGARTYDPTKGRYIQSDPIGLVTRKSNTYAYAHSNPFRFTDAMGLYPDRSDPNFREGNDGVLYYHGVPSDSVPYRAPNGQKFVTPPEANWCQVYRTGEMWGKDLVEVGLFVGPYGHFDWQRRDDEYFSAYIDASNYSVGVYMAGAGYSMWEMDNLAVLFALHLSHGNLSQQFEWWNLGYQAAMNGGLCGCNTTNTK